MACNDPALSVKESAMFTKGNHFPPYPRFIRTYVLTLQIISIKSPTKKISSNTMKKGSLHSPVSWVPYAPTVTSILTYIIHLIIQLIKIKQQMRTYASYMVL